MINADVIFYNGILATVNKNFDFQEALAVKGEKILAIGGNDEILKLAGSKTEFVDLHKQLVLPGMHDSHLHAADYAHNMSHLACDHYETIADLCAAVKEYSTGNNEAWILGNGVLQSVLDEGITCKDLDKVISDKPCVLMMWHGHGCVINSAALKINGITKDTPNPPGGIIGRFPNGEPNGNMQEASALQMSFHSMPMHTVEDSAEKFQKMQHFMNSMGYTSFTDSTVGPANNNREGGASGESALQAYCKLLDEGDLTCRVSVGFYSGRNGFQSAEILKEDLPKIPKSKNEDWLSFHMLKFFCDGVDTSHTGWMIHDYADMPGYRGECLFGGTGSTDEQQVLALREILKTAHDAGYQIGIHVVGDRAIDETMEAIHAAQSENPREDCRHCIIHADNAVTPEMIRKFVDYDLVLSNQPNLADDMYEKKTEVIGYDMAAANMPLRTLFDIGAVVAGGSDTIAGDYHDWRNGIVSAVKRKSIFTGEEYRPDLAITVEEAVRMYTINSAYQEFAEKKRGSLEEGKFADFIVVDRNIFEIEPEEIRKVNVLRTVVGGKTVYQK